MGWLSTRIVYLWFQITKFPPFDLERAITAYLLFGSLRVFSSILIKLCSRFRNPVGFHDTL